MLLTIFAGIFTLLSQIRVFYYTHPRHLPKEFPFWFTTLATACFVYLEWDLVLILIIAFRLVQLFLLRNEKTYFWPWQIKVTPFYSELDGHIRFYRGGIVFHSEVVKFLKGHTRETSTPFTFAFDEKGRCITWWKYGRNGEKIQYEIPN